MECNGNEEVNGDGKEGSRQATAMALKRAMVTATRVAGVKNAMVTANDGNKDGGQAKATRGTAMATAVGMAMATATVMAMVMATVTATATAMVKATATAMATAMATVMVMAMAMVTARAKVPMWAMMMVTRLVGNEEGKGKGGKGNNDGMRVAGEEEGKGGKATRVAGEPTAI